MRVNRDLETAAVNIRESVNKVVEVHPRGQARRSEQIVSGRYADEENLLPRNVNAVRKQVREQLRQPWTTREDKLFRPDLRAAGSSYVSGISLGNPSGNRFLK